MTCSLLARDSHCASIPRAWRHGVAHGDPLAPPLAGGGHGYATTPSTRTVPHAWPFQHQQQHLGGSGGGDGSGGYIDVGAGRTRTPPSAYAAITGGSDGVGQMRPAQRTLATPAATGIRNSAGTMVAANGQVLTLQRPATPGASAGGGGGGGGNRSFAQPLAGAGLGVQDLRRR